MILACAFAGGKIEGTSQGSKRTGDHEDGPEPVREVLGAKEKLKRMWRL